MLLFVLLPRRRGNSYRLRHNEAVAADVDSEVIA
jgi:hypothetical protein